LLSPILACGKKRGDGRTGSHRGGGNSRKLQGVPLGVQAILESEGFPPLYSNYGQTSLALAPTLLMLLACSKGTSNPSSRDSRIKGSVLCMKPIIFFFLIQKCLV
jgi:hypothetical protein